MDNIWNKIIASVMILVAVGEFSFYVDVTSRIKVYENDKLHSVKVYENDKLHNDKVRTEILLTLKELRHTISEINTFLATVNVKIAVHEERITSLERTRDATQNQ